LNTLIAKIAEHYLSCPKSCEESRLLDVSPNVDCYYYSYI
jgi:hypothetical protein